MAAGLGFKDFTTGEVLTAADVDGYLMQGVWVFANAAARTAAVTSPQEGNASFLKDTNSLEIYDGAAWVAYGAGDITGVTAGTGISGGGTSGTVTITNSMATEIAAKGDLIVGTGSATFDNLTVGANNTVLTADSSTATGLKWAAAGGASALTKITSASFSAQSSVAVDDVFSATYKMYYVTWFIEGSSTGADLELQFRYAGPSTQAANYFGSGFAYDRGNTISTWGFSATNQTIIYDTLSSGAGFESSGDITFANVGNSSQNPTYFGKGFGQSSQEIISYTGYCDTARTYTGFLLKPSTGTITGYYRVYGLEN